MEPNNNLEDERILLEDRITQRGAYQEHLSYIVNYLRGNSPFIDMFRHAKNLPNIDSRTRADTRELIAKLTKKEIPIVKNYFLALNAYLEGQSFDAVREAAIELISSKPIPDTIIAPPDSLFYKGPPGRTLANMREEV